MLYDQATIDLKVTFALLVDLSICVNSNVFISNANENKKLDHIYQHNRYIKKKNDEKNLYSSKGKYTQNERPRQFNERVVIH